MTGIFFLHNGIWVWNVVSKPNRKHATLLECWDLWGLRYSTTNLCSCTAALHRPCALIASTVGFAWRSLHWDVFFKTKEVSHYKYTRIHYVYPEPDHLNCTHALYRPKSQLQTCMTIRIDDRTGKHSAKVLRIYAQRTTANIPAGEVEKLLFFLCLPSSFCHWRIRKMDLKLILPSP
jgi:hypothetical protein